MDFRASPDDYWVGDEYYTHTADGHRIVVPRKDVCPDCGLPVPGSDAMLAHRMRTHPYGELLIWTSEVFLYHGIRDAFGEPLKPRSSASSWLWNDFEVHWTWDEEYIVALTPAAALWLRMNMADEDRVLYENPKKPEKEPPCTPS